MNKTGVIDGIWFSFIHHIKRDTLQALLPSFLLKLNPHSCLICFSMSYGITILLQKSSDMWYCRKNLDDCKQDVLLQQTSTQTSVTFCQRSVTGFDEDHGFFSPYYYFFMQQTVRGGRGRQGEKWQHKFLINPSHPTFSVLIIYIGSGCHRVLPVFIAAYILVHFGSLTKPTLWQNSVPLLAEHLVPSELSTGRWESQRGLSQDSQPELAKGILHITWKCFQQQNLKERKSKGWRFIYGITHAEVLFSQHEK